MFIGRVLLEPIRDDVWRVAAPVIYKSRRHYAIIALPVGFETDLASVPRFLPVTYALVGGTAVKASIVHDFIYHHPIYFNDVRRMLPRSICDDIFEEIMEDEGTAVWRRSIMWIGVRAAGWLSYGEIITRKEGGL